MASSYAVEGVKKKKHVNVLYVARAHTAVLFHANYLVLLFPILITQPVVQIHCVTPIGLYLKLCKNLMRPIFAQ